MATKKKSKKWFTDRIGKLIWNESLKSSNRPMNEHDAIRLYNNQQVYIYCDVCEK